MSREVPARLPLEDSGGLRLEVLRILVDNHARFLAFLEPRVGSREVAGDILREAFVRGLGRADTVRDPEAVTARFYRLLRHALADHHQRQEAEERALEPVAAEAEHAEAPFDEELMGAVCSCVLSLLDTLKPEYAAALRSVDLDGESVQAFAEEAGITSNNAAVRLYRAREALRRQLIDCCKTCATHGRLDCDCAASGPPPR